MFSPYPPQGPLRLASDAASLAKGMGWPRQESRPRCKQIAFNSGTRALRGRRRHLLPVLGAILHFLQQVRAEHHEPTLMQIPILPHGLIAGVLGEELVHARDDLAMGILDVEEQGPRKAVAVVGNRVEARLDAGDLHTLQLVLVLIKEGIAEDAERVGIGLDALHDEIVVLAGLAEGAVLAHGRAFLFDELLESVLVQLALFLLEVVERLAAFMHGELDESVARAGGRWRSVNRDDDIGQRP